MIDFHFFRSPVTLAEWLLEPAGMFVYSALPRSPFSFPVPLPLITI